MRGILAGNSQLRSLLGFANVNNESVEVIWLGIAVLLSHRASAHEAQPEHEKATRTAALEAKTRFLPSPIEQPPSRPSPSE